MGKPEDDPCSRPAQSDDWSKKGMTLWPAKEPEPSEPAQTDSSGAPTHLDRKIRRETQIPVDLEGSGS